MGVFPHHCEAHFLEEGKVVKFNVPADQLFRTRRCAELYLHQLHVDRDLRNLAVRGTRKELIKCLQSEPPRFVFPYLASVGGDHAHPYTVDRGPEEILRLVAPKRAGWLSDSVMNCYFRILDRTVERVHCVTSTVFPPNHEVDDAFFSEVYLRKHYRGRLHHCVGEGTLDTIIIPKNAYGNHWYLAVVNIKDQRLEIWDSLKKPKEVVYESTWRMLRLLKRSLIPDVEGSEWPSVVQDAVQQNNLDDCGVFTCRYARALAGGEDASSVTIAAVGDDADFRERMLRDIITGVITGLELT